MGLFWKEKTLSYNRRNTVKSVKRIIKSAKHIMKSMTQKHRSNSYIDDATEMVLPKCKCLQSIMVVTNTGAEKQLKVSDA